MKPIVKQIRCLWVGSANKIETNIALLSGLVNIKLLKGNNYTTNNVILDPGKYFNTSKLQQSNLAKNKIDPRSAISDIPKNKMNLIKKRSKKAIDKLEQLQ